MIVGTDLRTIQNDGPCIKGTKTAGHLILQLKTNKPQTNKKLLV